MPISINSVLPALNSFPNLITHEVNRINDRNDKRTLEAELIVITPFLAKKDNNYPRKALKDLITQLMPEDAREGYRSLEIQNLAPLIKSLCLLSILEAPVHEKEPLIEEILEKHQDLAAIVEILKIGLLDESAEGTENLLKNIQDLKKIVEGWRQKEDLSDKLLKDKPYLASIIKCLPTFENLSEADEEEILQKIDMFAPILEALEHIVQSSGLRNRTDLSIAKIIEWLKKKEHFEGPNYSKLDGDDCTFNLSVVRRIFQWISGPSNILELRCLEATVTTINIGARELLKKLAELEKTQQPLLSLEAQKQFVQEFVKRETYRWEPKAGGKAEIIINDKIFKRDETDQAAPNDRVSLKLSPNLTDLDNDLYKIHPEKRPNVENSSSTSATS